MNKEIEKHIYAVCDFVRDDNDNSDLAVSIYKAAKEFCDKFTPTNDEDKKGYDRLLDMLKSFSSEYGVSEKGVITHPQLECYIKRLQQILEKVEQNDFDFEEVDELQSEIDDMKEEENEFYEEVAFRNGGCMPYYTQDRFDKFDELIKELSDYDIFFDAEGEMDSMFPNRHDEDYDEDEFDVNSFFNRD